MTRGELLMKRLQELPRGGYGFRFILRLTPRFWILAVDPVEKRVHVVDTGRIRLEYKP